MSDFTPIETQEQLNSIIGERLARAKASAAEEVRAEFADYEDLKKRADECATKEADYASQIAALNEKLTGHDATVAELQAKIHGYERDSVKTSVMDELKIPKELRGYITGENEDEIRASASALAPFLRQTGGAPLRNTDAGIVDGVTAAFLARNPNIKL